MRIFHPITVSRFIVNGTRVSSYGHPFLFCSISVEFQLGAALVQPFAILLFCSWPLGPSAFLAFFFLSFPKINCLRAGCSLARTVCLAQTELVRSCIKVLLWLFFCLFVLIFILFSFIYSSSIPVLFWYFIKLFLSQSMSFFLSTPSPIWWQRGK